MTPQTIYSSWQFVKSFPVESSGFLKFIASLGGNFVDAATVSHFAFDKTVKFQAIENPVGRESCPAGTRTFPQ